MPSLVAVTFISSFAASAVEFVEAVTIVLAVGVTRGWRSTLVGVGVAIAVLALLVGIFGSAIVLLVPIDVLRVVIGGFLLIFGLQWLTKAILRAAGAKAKHDETAIYSREVRALAEEPAVPAGGMDWISFTVAFKGVLLEGLEVAFIVVTFGATAGALGPAAFGAAAAAAVVLLTAALVHRPLAMVPENTLKFGVSLMLVSFGTFWSGEGIGISWPGEDLAILGLLAGYAVLSLAAVWLLRSQIEARLGAGRLESAR